MLQRKHRLRRRSDFAKVYRRGHTKHAKDFSVKFQPNQLKHSRAAVVVSTKVSKKAVIRNRVRRRFYAQIRHLWPEIKPGVDIIVLCRHRAIDLKADDISKQLYLCLKQAGLIVETSTPKT